jgi:hypothetical protein
MLSQSQSIGQYQHDVKSENEICRCDPNQISCQVSALVASRCTMLFGSQYLDRHRRGFSCEYFRQYAEVEGTQSIRLTALEYQLSIISAIQDISPWQGCDYCTETILDIRTGLGDRKLLIVL